MILIANSKSGLEVLEKSYLNFQVIQISAQLVSSLIITPCNEGIFSWLLQLGYMSCDTKAIIQGGFDMKYFLRTILPLLFLTILATSYLFIELPIRVYANNYYNVIPMFILKSLYPLCFGAVMGLLAYFNKSDDNILQFSQIIAAIAFASINILISVYFYFYYFYASCYNFLLVGYIFVILIFQIIRNKKMKRNIN